MSVTLPMEVVNRSVPMLLVALPAAAGQGTCWMEMNLTALVSLHQLALFPFFVEWSLLCARIERNGHEESSCWINLLSISLSVSSFNLTDIFYIPSSANCHILQFDILLFLLQTLMSVIVMSWITAMRMQTAPTQRGVLPAPAILATLEMESTAQVSSIAAFPRMKRTSWSNGCTYVYS